MPFHLRPATNDDRAAVERVVFGVLAEYGLTPHPEGTDADLRDLEASYHAAGGSFDVLIDASGEVVGTVGLARVSETTCELRKMYLARAARGQGWGRRLLEHALARAAALGFTRVVLETASVLRDAVALYERSGFRPYVPEHLAARCDTAYYLDLTRQGDPPLS
jgi:putative acetyltransferase